MFEFNCFRWYISLESIWNSLEVATTCAYCTGSCVADFSVDLGHCKLMLDKQLHRYQVQSRLMCFATFNAYKVNVRVNNVHVPLDHTLFILYINDLSSIYTFILSNANNSTLQARPMCRSLSPPSVSRKIKVPPQLIPLRLFVC